MVKNFGSETVQIAMNAVVTSHLPVCLYSAAGKKAKRWNCYTRRAVTHTRCAVDRKDQTVIAKWDRHALGSQIVSPQRAQGRCFLDLRLPEAEEAFFTGQARYEERSSTAKGATVGVVLRCAEGLTRRSSFG
jgi:hypothetical protein